MTMASTESKARSFKSVPKWVKFHYPDGLRRGKEVPNRSEKALPLPPLPISPGSWFKAKVLRHSHLTTTSEDKKGRHIVSEHGDKSVGTEQAAFERSGWKQVQVGQRISGASVDSLVAEKQEVW